MAEVQLSEIEKRFADNRILNRLDLTVPAGQYLVILGRSGCGKTTTLKIIAGLESADHGQVTIGGRDMGGVPPRKRDVAMVFQGDSLYPHLTIEQSLRVGLKSVLSGDDLRKRIDEARELAGIDQILDRKPGSLSGGELRRAAVAKAIVRRSSVRLLDEPLSALDENVRQAIGESILRWHADCPGTTIHVTHDGQEAMRMADRIAVISEGKIVQSASPQEIYESPVNRTVAVAIGSPLMSFVDAAFVGGRLSFGCAGVEVAGQPYATAAKDKEISVGIRAPSCRFLAGESMPQHAGVLMTGKILRVQIIHGSRLARIAVGNSSVDAELADDSISVGDQARFFVAADDLYVFDRATGKRESVSPV